MRWGGKSGKIMTYVRTLDQQTKTPSFKIRAINLSLVLHLSTSSENHLLALRLYVMGKHEQLKLI